MTADDYHLWERYGSSKLANRLFANELDRRMQSEGSHVLAVSVHPGIIVETNLHDNVGLGNTLPLLQKLWLRSGAINHMLFGYKKNTKQGFLRVL